MTPNFRGIPRPGSARAPRAGFGAPAEVSDGRRPWLLAALALAALGPGFFLVYGWCNEFTARRLDVGSFHFAWERSIPFVPVMIIPYLSVDLFFCGSFFLCRSREELGVLSRRIALAIGLSALGFLLFPLRYGWPRPAVDGWLGALFAPLNALDKPFNLCPSLHISLRTLAWTAFGRHTRGPLRFTLKIWFFLIGLSTLLVFQHHLIDVVGGWLVALACCATFRERGVPWFPWSRPKGAGASPTGSSAPCLPAPSVCLPGPASAGSVAHRTTG